MATVEERRKALSDSLERVDKILNDFENSITHSNNPYEKRNFDRTASLVIKDEKNSQVLVKKVENEDVRLSMDLDKLESECRACERCKLCSERKNTVFGEGITKNPLVMVIGEGPGETEDNMGRPFVGKAGQYLDKWLSAISVSRTENCYITNVVKCRPPMNRDPEVDEKNICKNFVIQQINLIKPKSILCLGKNASELITGEENATMASLRGKFRYYDSSIPVMCTYHPAAVLRNPDLKRPVWEDLQKLAKFLNIKLPRR